MANLSARLGKPLLEKEGISNGVVIIRLLPEANCLLADSINIFPYRSRKDIYRTEALIPLLNFRSFQSVFIKSTAFNNICLLSGKEWSRQFDSSPGIFTHKRSNLLEKRFRAIILIWCTTIMNTQRQHSFCRFLNYECIKNKECISPNQHNILEFLPDECTFNFNSNFECLAYFLRSAPRFILLLVHKQKSSVSSWGSL